MLLFLCVDRRPSGASPVVAATHRRQWGRSPEASTVQHRHVAPTVRASPAPGASRRAGCDGAAGASFSAPDRVAMQRRMGHRSVFVDWYASRLGYRLVVTESAARLFRLPAQPARGGAVGWVRPGPVCGAASLYQSGRCPGRSRGVGPLGRGVEEQREGWAHRCDAIGGAYEVRRELLLRMVDPVSLRVAVDSGPGPATGRGYASKCHHAASAATGNTRVSMWCTPSLRATDSLIAPSAAALMPVGLVAAAVVRAATRPPIMARAARRERNAGFTCISTTHQSATDAKQAGAGQLPDHRSATLRGPHRFRCALVSAYGTEPAQLSAYPRR